MNTQLSVTVCVYGSNGALMAACILTKVGAEKYSIHTILVQFKNVCYKFIPPTDNQ